MVAARHGAVDVKGQRRHDGAQIGVSCNAFENEESDEKNTGGLAHYNIASMRALMLFTCAFAHSIDSPLNQSDPVLDANHRVGDSHATVVVAMNANSYKAIKVLDDILTDSTNLPRHAATVGVAKNKTRGPRIDGGFAAPNGIIRIGTVSIKKVLEIHHDAPPRRHQVRDGIGNHLQIFLQLRFENLRHLPTVRLGDNAHGRGLRVQQGPDLRIVADVDLFAPRAAKGHQLGLLRPRQFHFGARKELGVFGIGTGPTRFNVIHVKGRESATNLELVVGRSRDGLSLCAVCDEEEEDGCKKHDTR